MEHVYIEEHNIADRYLLGKLSEDEQVRFEEHFINCAQCLDRLESTDDLRGGLRTVAAEKAAVSRAYARAGVLVWVAGLSGRRQAALLAGVILLIAMPAALLVLKRESASRDLAQANKVTLEWQRRYEERERTARGLMNEIEARERQSSRQREPLAAQFERERENRKRPSDEGNKATGSQASVPVFALSIVRSGDFNLSQPVNRITLPHSSKLVILLLELESDSDLQSYRADLSTANGRSIWRASNLKPISEDALALSLDSSLFKQDNYLLTLERLTAQRRYEPIAQYTFRVVVTH